MKIKMRETNLRKRKVINRATNLFMSEPMGKNNPKNDQWTNGIRAKRINQSISSNQFGNLCFEKKDKRR